MKQFTVELDEMICKWLEHISEVTGDSVEKLIANGIYHQVAALEDGAFNAVALYPSTILFFTQTVLLLDGLYFFCLYIERNVTSNKITREL